jgi:N-acetylmuramoyl-L-alanine amidase
VLPLLLIAVVLALLAQSGGGSAPAPSYGYGGGYGYGNGGGSYSGDPYTGSDVSGTDQDTLARTIWGEARNQSREGQEGVANVVLNRYHQGWGISVAAVCTAPKQFSCWNAGDPNLPKLKAVTTADGIFRQCLQIATQATAGQLPDNTGGAQFYYDTSIARPAFWNAEGIRETRQIGALVFGRKG